MRSKFTSASRSPHVFFFGTIFKPVKFRPGVNVPIPQLFSIRCVVCVSCVSKTSANNIFIYAFTDTQKHLDTWT